MIRDLLAEGSISAAFIPSYEQQKLDGGRAAAHRFTRAVLTLLLLFCSLLALCLWWWAPLWIEQLAPSLEPSQLAVTLLKELLPFLLVVPFLAVLRGVLLGADRNRSAVASQALQNLILVAAGGWMVNQGMSGSEAASGWILAFLVGSLAAFLLLALSSRSAQPFPLPTTSIRVGGIRRFSGDLAIQLLASSVTYLNSLMAMRFASLIGPGSITHLDIAFRFHFLPIALIGVALGTIAGVDAARLAARQQHRVMAIRIGRSLRNALFIALPAAVGLMLLAAPLLRLLLQHGNYDAASASQTIEVLQVFCLAIPMACLCPALIRTTMVLGYRRLLIGISSVALLTNWTVLSLLDGRWGVPGLAAASVASTLASWMLLEIGLRRTLALPRPRVSAAIRNGLITAAVALSTALVTWGSSSTFVTPRIQDLVTIGASIPLGIAIVSLLGRRLGAPEVIALERMLHSIRRVLRKS